MNTDTQTYTVYVEEPEQDAPEVVVMSICNGHAYCFHIAMTGSNTDIENAKAVCSQDILYMSMDSDPLLYFAVYDRCSHMVCFGLLDPKHRTFEDVAQFQMACQEMHVAARLQAYVASNTEALRQGSTAPLHAQVQARDVV